MLALKVWRGIITRPHHNEADWEHRSGAARSPRAFAVDPTLSFKRWNQNVKIRFQSLLSTATCATTERIGDRYAAVGDPRAKVWWCGLNVLGPGWTVAS